MVCIKSLLVSNNYDVSNVPEAVLETDLDCDWFKLGVYGDEIHLQVNDKMIVINVDGKELLYNWRMSVLNIDSDGYEVSEELYDDDMNLIEHITNI